MIGISSISRMLAFALTTTLLAGSARLQDKPPSTTPGSQPGQGTTPPAGSTTPPAGQQPTTPPPAQQPTTPPAAPATKPPAGQAATTPPPGQAATTPSEAKPGEKGGDKAPFKPEELEQILAPIALYPDDLLSQILMATTYPLEIVEADRWVKKNKSLKGDAAAKALEKEDWDPSVKSLVNLPDVLSLLSEKLDWTQKLGDAFIGQQKEVMDTIQKMRQKAKDAGKLETNENQKIEVKTEGTTEVIVIQSAQPNTVYVPVYNPTVVYGTWAYPSYPPYPYYPPAYGVGMGLAVGFAWGYAWGHCNWGGGDVDIDINRNTNINNNIDRDKYKNRQQGDRGQGGRDGQGGRGGQGGQSKFKHDPSHRQGVPYRDSKSASQFGGRSQGQAAQARESYRGRSQSPSAGTADRGAASGRGGSGAGSRPSAGTSNRASTGASTRGGSSTRSSSGLSGVSSGGRAATSSSSRGRSSLSSSGGGRSGGGGGRGGGGRGGGGRR